MFCYYIINREVQEKEGAKLERFKSVLFRILIIVAIILLALLVLFISINSEKVPELYAFTDSRTSKAVTGNYTWYAFSEVLKEESIEKQNITYKTENTLRLYPGEVFSISSHLSSTSRRNFSVEKISYDSSYSVSVPVEYKQPSNSFSELNVAEITAPTIEDTYYYYINLSYHEKGKVEYALKVIVSTEPKYELEQLLNYKNTNLYDIDKIDNILNILPYSNNKSGIIASYNATPKKLIIYYSDLMMDRETLSNNVLSLFVLIPEAEVIEYKSDDISYIYLRRELELKYGRDLNDYANDKNIWEAEVFFGERQLDQNNSLHNLLRSIIIDAVGVGSGDRETGIVVNLDSFDTNTLYTISDIICI